MSDIISSPRRLTSLQLRRLVALRRDGYGLPGIFYQDAALYMYEWDKIWRRGWIFVGHTCEVIHPGDFFTVALASDSLIIMRQGEGSLRAFHNVCTHRGTLLTEQSSGSMRALVCPYHQWTFTRGGELLSCHGMQADIDKSELGLHQVHIEVCEGLIFVSLAEHPQPFESARALMAPFVRPQGLMQAKVAKIVDYDVAANWKLIWENNRECYHCNINHPQYIKSNFDIYEDEYISPRIQQRLQDALAQSKTDELAISHRQGGLAAFPDAVNNIWYSANRTVLAEGFVSESVDGRRVASLVGEYEDENVGVLRMRSLPNFWSHASCDHAVTTRLLPIGLHHTQVRITWLVHAEAQEGIDYHLERLMPFWQLTSEQDWELCERVQRGVNSTAYRPGPLSQTREYNLDAFLRWYLFQLNEGPILL